MPRTEPSLASNLPLSRAALRSIAARALCRSPLRRLRTASQPGADARTDNAFAPPTGQHRLEPADTPDAASTASSMRSVGGAVAFTMAGAPRTVVALPTPPVSSAAAVRAMMAQDEDLITDVVTDASLAYLELPPDARPLHPQHWFRTVMERLARREAHRNAWHLGMLLPATPTSANEEEEMESNENFTFDELTPEAIAIADELCVHVGTIWGTSSEERQLLSAVVSEM